VKFINLIYATHAALKYKAITLMELQVWIIKLKISSRPALLSRELITINVLGRDEMRSGLKQFAPLAFHYNFFLQNSKSCDENTKSADFGAQLNECCTPIT
jgi:hypothetical protein